jgi:hypothetical protein
MWQHRSHLLAPLTTLTSKTTPFKWTDSHQQAFEAVKQIISKEVLLSFPDYTKPFEMYTDASAYQMGAVLRQGDRMLSFFSKKLNPAQQNYSAGEKEMLSVCEAFKDFRTMILGYPITVYIDHKNWTHDKKVFTNSRIMRWRLVIEEFAPIFKYLEGKKNIVADALSRLAFETTKSETTETNKEIFAVPLPNTFYTPITFKEIGQAQNTDEWIQKLMSQSPARIGTMFDDI